MSKGFRKPLTLLKSTKTSCHRMWMTAGDRVWEMVILPSCPVSSPRVTVCGDKWTGCLYDTRSSSRTRAAEVLQDRSQMSPCNITHFFVNTSVRNFPYRLASVLAALGGPPPPNTLILRDNLLLQRHQSRTKT